MDVVSFVGGIIAIIFLFWIYSSGEFDGMGNFVIIILILLSMIFVIAPLVVWLGLPT